MANDARTQFIDGLRVTADHLQHLQDRLRDAMRDVRQTIGLGRVAWGLHVTVAADSVIVTPGVAFAPSGIRLNIDTDANLPIPGGAGPWRVTLKATEQDRASLRVGDKPTLIQLITSVAIEPAGDPAPGEDALVVATITGSGASRKATQDPAIFAIAGNHAHSGKFVQDAAGRWHYDGPNVEGEQGPKGDKGDPGAAGALGAAGAKGDKGDPGAAGAAGAAAAKGDKGDPGAAGAAGRGRRKGDKGDPGAAGAAGAAGAKGDKGDPGAAGAQGAPGAQGAQGPPGPGLDPDPTIISKVSWPMGASVNFNQGTEPARATATRLERRDAGGPNAPGPAAGRPGLVRAELAGRIRADHRDSGHPRHRRSWIRPGSPGRRAKPRSQFRTMLSNGGQVLLRVHCGHMFDTKERPVSASLNAVTPLPNKAPVYGGVWEAWFFVIAG